MTYCGMNPCSMSIPILLLGRSLTWPKDDSIEKSLPKKRAMVLALVGDSTITNFILFFRQYQILIYIPAPVFLTRPFISIMVSVLLIIFVSSPEGEIMSSR